MTKSDETFYPSDILILARKAFAIAFFLVLEAGALYASYQLGIPEGRSQYHEELLIELESKGGAPLLIYPPDCMEFIPEGE